MISFSGPSGVGKNTIRQALLKKYPQLLKFIATTPKVHSEVELQAGIYNFISKEEFEQKRKKGDFLEWEEVYQDTFYGTDRLVLEQMLKMNKIVTFDIDYAGALSIKKVFGDRILNLFIIPPSLQELEARLRSRARDSEEKILQRLAKAKFEIDQQDKFDIVVANENLEQTLDDISALIEKILEARNLTN
jgi:guanylate kinase